MHTQQVEIFRGHFQFGDTSLQVEFDVPAGASQTEKDAAFLNALSLLGIRKKLWVYGFCRTHESLSLSGNCCGV